MRVEQATQLQMSIFSEEEKRRKKLHERGTRPSLDTLIEWAEEGMCEATDGCIVETDGTCQHGHESWLLALNLI